MSLKLFFRYLQLEAVLKDNLAELLGSQKLWQRVPTVLSTGQIDALLTSPSREKAAGEEIERFWNCCTRPVAVRARFRICD